MATTSNKIPTAESYLKQLASKANKVQVEINKLKVQETKLNSELTLFKNQLAIKQAILQYTKNVETQVGLLRMMLQDTQEFFQTPDGRMVSKAHMDLPPADTTMTNIMESAKEVAARLYQAMFNVYFCADKMSTVAEIVAKGMGASSQDNQSSSSGFVSYSSGPSDGLYSKMKGAVTAGMATLQALTNLYLNFVQFVHMAESIYYDCQNTDKQIEAEVKQLDSFFSRNQTRINIETQFVKALDGMIKRTSDELAAIKQRITSDTLDHNLLMAEFNAANSSVRPETKVAAGASKSA